MSNLEAGKKLSQSSDDTIVSSASKVEENNIFNFDKSIIELLEKPITLDSEDHLKLLINKMLSKLYSNIGENYQFCTLFIKETIEHHHFENLVNSFKRSNFKLEEKPLVLIIETEGGAIKPAYEIASYIQKLTHNVPFEAVIPRSAKSSGTMIALSADKIHLGEFSDLGPIDPQIKGFPVLGVFDSLEYLCSKSSESSFYLEYLQRSLSIEKLGFYLRVLSATESYCMDLLNKNKMDDSMSKNRESIVKEFVWRHKEHGYRIDSNYMVNLLGPENADCNSDLLLHIEPIFDKLRKTSMLLASFWGVEIEISGCIGDIDCITLLR